MVVCSYNPSAVEEKAGRQILARLDPSQTSPFGELRVRERLCLKKQNQKQRATPKEWHSRFSSGFPTHVHPQVNMRSQNKKSASIRIVLHIPGVDTLYLRAFLIPCSVCTFSWTSSKYSLEQSATLWIVTSLTVSAMWSLGAWLYSFLTVPFDLLVQNSWNLKTTLLSSSPG